MLFLHRWGNVWYIVSRAIKLASSIVKWGAMLVECLLPSLHMLRVVPMSYSVHVWAYYGLSLVLLVIFPIVDSQIRCLVTCMYYLWREKWNVTRSHMIMVHILAITTRYAKIANGNLFRKYIICSITDHDHLRTNVGWRSWLTLQFSS